MLQKDKLRKADIFTGCLFFLVGLWIVWQALKMPMKDSWGGVQNVWFVSPAIFPLFVGAMIMFLGALLTRTALKEVGFKELGRVVHWLGSPEILAALKSTAAIRFYAIVILFLGFVYLNLPRVDFFLCSVLFLSIFISMFYLEEDNLLKKMLWFYLGGTVSFILYLISGFSQKLRTALAHPNDWFTIVFIIAYFSYSFVLIRDSLTLRKRMRTSLLLAVIVPFVFGIIFKYLLLVPMPTEGLVVEVLDAIWYREF